MLLLQEQSLAEEAPSSLSLSLCTTNESPVEKTTTATITTATVTAETKAQPGSELESFSSLTHCQAVFVEEDVPPCRKKCVTFHDKNPTRVIEFERVAAQDVAKVWYTEHEMRAFQRRVWLSTTKAAAAATTTATRGASSSSSSSSRQRQIQRIKPH